MGDYVFRVQNTIVWHPNSGIETPGIVVKAHDGNKVIGSADFVPFNYYPGKKNNKKNSNAHLESQDTEVDEKYRGKGIATMMYAVVKSLGFSIEPSMFQSNTGRDMWSKWGKDADNLTKEETMDENKIIYGGSKVNLILVYKQKPIKLNKEPVDYTDENLKKYAIVAYIHLRDTTGRKFSIQSIMKAIVVKPLEVHQTNEEYNDYIEEK
jgi:hypothetical protein